MAVSFTDEIADRKPLRIRFEESEFEIGTTDFKTAQRLIIDSHVKRQKYTQLFYPQSWGPDIWSIPKIVDSYTPQHFLNENSKVQIWIEDNARKATSLTLKDL